MPKERLKVNKGLPKRWVFYHGAFYYRVPPEFKYAWDNKTKFYLGRSLSDAYKNFASRITIDRSINTIGDLLDRYLIEVVPTKAPSTRQGNIVQLKKLRAVFGEMPLTPFSPQLIYQYVDKRSHKIAAHREVEVLSHAYTKALQWGLIDRHPFLGQVRLEGERPRTRYVEDWEISECLSLAERNSRGGVAVIKAYIRLKLLTGMARGDLLRLQPEQHFMEEGILIQRHKTAAKTGKRTCYTWTEELRAAVKAAMDARPASISPFLFCNRSGEGYINEETGNPPGWKSMWQRFMRRVLNETNVKEYFREHDLRAKVASDAESLLHAQELLSHSDSRTTNRIYRRKTVFVKPLK